MNRQPDVVGDSLAFLTDPLHGITLTASEVVKLASVWWDKTGRKIINRNFNRDHGEGPSKTRLTGKSMTIRVKGKGDVVFPSRILEGKPWDELDRRERALVVKSWLSQYRHQYRRGHSRVIVQ